MELLIQVLILGQIFTWDKIEIEQVQIAAIVEIYKLAHTRSQNCNASVPGAKQTLFR